MRQLFYFIFLLLFSLQSFSQETTSLNDSLVTIRGTLKNTDNEPVYWAYIYNIRTKQGTTSDSLGVFHFTCHKNDSLQISSLGYRTSFLTVKDSAFQSEQDISYTLEKKEYQLGTIDVFSSRWEDFKREILSHPTENTTNIHAIPQQLLTDMEMLCAKNRRTTEGIGLTVPIKFRTKKDKSLMKVAELQHQAGIDAKIKEKLNNELISRITGLQTQAEIMAFVKFCNFDRNVLSTIKEYDLIVMLRNKYEIYLASKEDKKPFYVE